MDFMSEAAARNWCEKAVEPYTISIEDLDVYKRQIVERTDDVYRAYLRAGDEKRAIRRKKTGLSCRYRGCKRIVA